MEWRTRVRLVLVSCVVMASLSATATDQVTVVGRLVPILRKSVFKFPDEATPNNNRSIGPFCCAARTATVYTSTGQPVGYIYFFDWDGQSVQVGNRSFVPNVKVLVSGLNDLSNPASGHKENFAIFEPGPLRGGTRVVKAGALFFKISIDGARIRYSGTQRLFEMSSIAATATVSTERLFEDTLLSLTCSISVSVSGQTQAVGGVSLRHPMGWSAEAELDSNGRFSFENIPRSTYKLGLEGKDGRALQSVPEQEVKCSADTPSPIVQFQVSLKNANPQDRLPPIPTRSQKP